MCTRTYQNVTPETVGAHDKLITKDFGLIVYTEFLEKPYLVVVF